MPGLFVARVQPMKLQASVKIAPGALAKAGSEAMIGLFLMLQRQHQTALHMTAHPWLNIGRLC